MKFIPIKSLSSVIPFNLRLRYLFSSVAEIIARMEALEAVLSVGASDSGAAPEPETVADEDSQVITENESPSEEENKEFNWQESEDIDALKSFAKSIKLEIPGTVKKAETIKEKIKAHFSAQTGD